MPIGSFFKCLSGDLQHLSRNKYFSEAAVQKRWPPLFDQHLAAHGLPENYEEYLRKMTEAADYYSQAYNGKKWQIVRARVCEAEAQQLMGGESERIETTCARISRELGFPVRASECSVVEFYSYIALISSED